LHDGRHPIVYDPVADSARARRAEIDKFELPGRDEGKGTKDDFTLVLQLVHRDGSDPSAVLLPRPAQLIYGIPAEQSMTDALV
jgi:hypothetical protein